jgi:membrane protease YdiL (CAAX protease family)
MRKAAPLIPYVAVALGLYGLHSAWAALGLYHAGMLATLIVLHEPKAEANRLTIHRVWIVLAAGLFAVGGVAIYVLWPYLSLGTSITDRLAAFGVTKHTWPPLAIYFCIANSTLEEFFWRGRLMSHTVRPVGGDFLFAGYHAFVLLAFANPIWTIPVFVACAFAAWLWRMLRLATGGLAVPIITHIIADVSIAVAVQLRGFG